MKLSRALVLFLCGFLLFSCSQKFPVPKTDNEGILVIPHKATKNTDWDFGYNYIFKAVGDGLNETIKVYPNISRDFFITKTLPPGKYQMIGISSIGVRSKSVRASKLKTFRKFLGPYFEIKPKQITILDQIFIVTQKKRFVSSASQSWKFEFVNNEMITGIVKELKTLKNSELWKIFNPLSSRNDF